MQTVANARGYRASNDHLVAASRCAGQAPRDVALTVPTKGGICVGSNLTHGSARCQDPNHHDGGASVTAGQFDPRLVAYFGDGVLQSGFMPLPNLFLRHYTQLGLSNSQAMFLLQLMAAAWDL